MNENSIPGGPIPGGPIPGGPIPGRPHTYERIPNDHRRYGVSDTIVLVPIRDPKRDRTVFVKVEERSFDALPDSIRERAWCLARDGGAKEYDLRRFSVRAGGSGKSQVGVARLIMKAKPGQAVQIINGNRLDLRTTNLRFRRDNAGRHVKRDDTAIVLEREASREERLA